MLPARPLPDEFIAGHIGRLACLNGADRLERMIVELTQDREGLSQLLDPLEIYQSAAAIAGMTGQEYLVGHTLFPIERFCASSDTDIDTYEDSRVYRQRTTVLHLNGPIRLCSACVQQDIQRHGFSYWHRTHQIYGVSWCIKHLIPLLVVEDSKNYASCPAQLLPSAKEPEGDPQGDCRHPIIRQYATASSWLLNQGRRSTRARIGALLNEAIRQNGLQCTGRGDRFRLSDLVRASVPTEWLTRHFPKIAQGKPLQYCPAIDAAVFGTRCHVSSILLALSTLQVATTTNLHRLTSAEIPLLRSRSIRAETVSQRMLSAYIASQGIEADMSRRLSRSFSAVVMFCRSRGMPSLRYADAETRRMIIAFLGDASDEERAAWLNQLRPLLLAVRQPSACWLRETALALLPAKYRT